MTNIRVLHVTECYSGGVGLAIDNIARVVPDVEHHLLYSGGDAPDDARGFASSTPLPTSPLSAIAEVTAAVKRLRPDAVHAHSSWAGVFSRVRPLDVPVIYEPHCYKFEDPAQSTPARTLVRWAEKTLGRRSSATVVLSPREDDVAAELNPRTPRTYVPNVATRLPGAEHPATGFAHDDTVIMSGRIAPQKDPAFFAAVARGVRTARPQTTFRWLGGGDDIDALVDAGVEVTGWVSGDELAAELARPALYFHSAAYEGFPLSVLDAAAFEHPLVVRDIASFDGVTVPKATSVDDAVALIIATLDDDAHLQRAADAARTLNDTMSAEVQRDALMSLYRSLRPE